MNFFWWKKETLSPDCEDLQGRLSLEAQSQQTSNGKAMPPSEESFSMPSKDTENPGKQMKADMETIAMQETPAAEKIPICEDPSILHNMLSDFRKHVNGQIQTAKEISEKEILCIGDCVNKIVNHAREYIDQSKNTMDHSFSEQSTAMEDYLNYSRQTIETQSNTVKNALSLSNQISEAGEAVDRLAGEAKLLALNATIEAARLGGSSGKAFGVISEEMNHLSNQIATTNGMIGDTIKAVQESLPSIMKQTTAQIEKLETFMGVMDQLKKNMGDDLSTSNDAGNTHLEMIMSLAYAALSHLQYQDPMIQNLQKIDYLMKDLHEELNQGLNINDTPDQIKQTQLGCLPEYQHHEDLDEGDTQNSQNSGEIVLF